jgi:predicted transcriptional regulator
MKPKNPWQKLLQQHIHNRYAPPRPEGFYTRPEISELWGLKINTTSRLLSEMEKNKSVEMRKHPFIIKSKDKTAIRHIKTYKILSFKPPHK